MSMKEALKMAHRAFRCQEVPVGAVIVHQEKIIARAHNLSEHWSNPLAHAEFLVVLQAQKKLSSPYLEECSLYVTLEPCHFCMSALNLVRLGKLYFGAYQKVAFNAYSFDAIGGICESACQALLTTFFQQKRS